MGLENKSIGKDKKHIFDFSQQPCSIQKDKIRFARYVPLRKQFHVTFQHDWSLHRGHYSWILEYHS